jgi:nucleotide-binding universal stress UspA family protein
MKPVQTILVPTDFSDQSSMALSYAIWFAARIGASIDLLHVVYPGTDVMDFPVVSAQVTQVQIETARDVMQAFVGEALGRLSLDQTPEVHRVVEVGTPYALIPSTAKELDADLIIMGTRGEHNRLEVAFGSVTTGVLQRSEIPVLVVPGEQESIQVRKIGYATSLDESDPYHIWQAAQMLAPFTPFLHIVHVRTKEDRSKDIDLAELEAFLGGKNLALQMNYHESTNPDVEEALEDFVSLYKIDLLIMYSPKRNLFERIGHRSLTRKMALYSHVPLLVMK